MNKIKTFNVIPIKIIAVSAVIALLAACSQSEQIPTARPIAIQSKPLNRPVLSLPPVDRFRARDVTWRIITPENAEQVFSDLESQGQPVVLFGLTESGYENAALNTSESLRVIRQQRAVIDGYERYYFEVDDVIYKYNQSIK